MLNILHLSKFYPPTAGGIERAVEQYAEVAAAAGHRVTVVAFADASNAPSRQCIRGVDVLRIRPGVRLLSGQLSLNYVRTSLRLARTADILHIHEPNPLATLTALISPRRPKIVVSWHADIRRQWYVVPLMKPLQKAVCARASAILTSSERTRDSSYLLPDLGRPCQLLPYSIDLTAYRTARADDAAIQLTQAHYGRFALAVGRMVSYKGFDILIRALVGTSVRVLFAGEGVLRTQLEALASSLGVGQQVVFVGGVSDPQLAALYAACEFFVLPSVDEAEAFGIVQIEAMACSKAVVNTRLNTGVPDVSPDGVTGLTVAPRDPMALREAIQRLWNEPSLAASLGRNGYARAHALYDRDILGDKLLRIYGL